MKNISSGSYWFPNYIPSWWSASCAAHRSPEFSAEDLDEALASCKAHPMADDSDTLPRKPKPCIANDYPAIVIDSH